MASAWNKLKKSLSLKLPSDSRYSNVSETSHRALTPASSSSSGFRFSRSISSRSVKKTCAICLGNMRPGQGQAIFTAECSHSFHFNCIASSVKHGNHLCPICRSKWKDIPLQAPVSIIDPQLPGAGRVRVTPFDLPLNDSLPNLPHHHFQQPQSHVETHQFSDDEPLLNISSSLELNSHTSLPIHQVVTVRASAEFPAIPANESRPAFTVLVGVHAPSLPQDGPHRDRAPIDLVTVLDISGSMAGTKLSLLKRAVRFVIRNLGPADRLAIVAFSSTARRIFPLRRMSETGREGAIVAINSLVSSGGTNIVEGLKKGVQVLEDRREQNPVASIILLSDGKDTYNIDTRNSRNQGSLDATQVQDYLNLLPSSIHPHHNGDGGDRRPLSMPVHTFGFGSDHDATFLHAISDASGGTFSFIQDSSIIQDAFAMCIGGLLSVVTKDLRLTVKSSTPGVVISLISTGKYFSKICNHGREGVIELGDLYADEKKEFLLHVFVPVFSAEASGEIEPVTPLLSVLCSYKDPVSQEVVRVEGETVKIRRPDALSSGDNIVSLEVDRQMNRLRVAESIAEAQELAEKGNLEGAQSVLANRRTTLLGSASAQAGDGLCNWLEAELKEIRERMASQELYEESGRAYVLSGLSSHAWQRATTRGDTTTQTMVVGREGSNLNSNGGVGYETPSMVNMVTRSQVLGYPANYLPEPVRRLNKSCSLVYPRH